MTKRVVGYFENWAQYRQAGGKFFPAQINPGFFTHINFAFGLIGFVTWSVDPNPTRTGSQRYTGDYTVQPVEWNDQSVLYPALQALKQQNGNLKTLLSIGGWSMNSCSDTPNPGNEHPYGPYTCQLFSQMASDPNNRAQFISSAIAYAQKYGFDGIDIDWEYPGYVGRGGGPNDLANFLSLVQEFRAAAGPNFLVTMAAPAIVPTGLPQSYHDDPSTFFSWLQQCSQSLDWLNIMSYDYHGAFDDPVAIGTGVNSPLPQDSTPNGAFSVFQTVTTYLAAGIPPDKMVLGMPTYGRGYVVSNPGALASNSTYGQPFSGPSPAGPATQVPGVLAYYEITQQLASGALTEVWDTATLTPYAYNPTTGEWVSYDSPDSVAYKTAYVNAMNLGGAMIWSIDDDDFANGYPLVTRIVDVLNNPADGPQLPGTLTSQIDFPLDLLGIFTSDLSPVPLWRAPALGDASSKRGSAEALTSLLSGISGPPAVVDYNGMRWLFSEGPFENGVLSAWTYDLLTGDLNTVKINNQNNGTTGPPAAAVYNQQLYVVHEGAGQNGMLYYFIYDGATDTWTDDQVVPIGVAQAGSQRHDYPSVALAAFNDGLYCVYEGGTERGGGQLWFNRWFANQWGEGFWLQPQRVQDSQGNGFGTSNGPGLAVIDKKLSCWHEGAFQDGQLWVTNFDTVQWSPDHKVNVSTSGPPAVMAIPIDQYDNRKLFVIHEGPEQSGVLWSFNNNTFEDAPLQKGKSVSHGSPRLDWTPANVQALVYGEARTASGTGAGATYTFTIQTNRRSVTFGFNLLIPSDRIGAPYPPLDSYSLDLRKHNPLYNPVNFPVSMTRHHIVPHNLLVDFWNRMIENEAIASRSTRRSFAADALLRAMSDMLFAPIPDGSTGINLNDIDKNVLSLLLYGIEFGYIVHDPTADVQVRPPGWDSFRQVYEWLPGDLFIGPGIGTNPTPPPPTKNWRSDDPGDGFEKNAKVIVGGHFSTWEAAYALMSEYTAFGPSPRVNQAALTLAQIARNPAPFPLNSANWSYDGKNTKQFKIATQSQPELHQPLRESAAAE